MTNDGTNEAHHDDNDGVNKGLLVSLGTPNDSALSEGGPARVSHQEDGDGTL